MQAESTSINKADNVAGSPMSLLPPLAQAPLSVCKKPRAAAEVRQEKSAQSPQEALI